MSSVYIIKPSEMGPQDLNRVTVGGVQNGPAYW